MTLSVPAACQVESAGRRVMRSVDPTRARRSLSSRSASVQSCFASRSTSRWRVVAICRSHSSRLCSIQSLPCTWRFQHTSRHAPRDQQYPSIIEITGASRTKTLSPGASLLKRPLFTCVLLAARVHVDVSVRGDSGQRHGQSVWDAAPLFIKTLRTPTVTGAL